MLSPRWRKLVGDLSQAKQRLIIMTIAVAAGLFSVTAMLDSYSILTREMAGNYGATVPASAAFEMENVDDELVSAVRRYPGIADAEARATILSRIRSGNDWFRLLLFVIRDFDDLRLNKFTRQGGAWPPPAGTMLMERSSLKILKSGAGAVFSVKMPLGGAREIVISGLTHDPGLAPSIQEQTVYGYITRDTLVQLGEAPRVDELRVLFAGPVQDRAAVESKARELAEWLRAQGSPVQRIQVPPPGRHPHQGQMTAVLFLFLAFSFLAFILASILVAALMSALLTKQVREIGVMKAIGADASQIAVLYFVMAGALGACATVISVPLGLHAAEMFSNVVANLLNFTIMSRRVPHGIYAFEIAAGILVPLIAAAVPVVRASRVSVRAAVSDYGVGNDVFGGSRLDPALSRLQGLDRFFLLALRNTFRRRGRLILSLSLLAAAGGMFLGGLNVREAWQEYIGRIHRDRYYDVEIRLQSPARVDDLFSALKNVAGIQKTEAWGFIETTPAQPGMIDLAGTYPDGGHGSFLLLGAPAETTMVRYPLLAGRWLRSGDADAVVLNQMALAFAADAAIGDDILLSIGGKPVRWRIVGIVEEIGSPAAAYVTAQGYERAAGSTGRANMLRIAASPGNDAERDQVIRTIEAALSSSGFDVLQSLPLSVLKTAMGEHIAVLVGTLLAAAALLGLIGILGLASSMNMNVVERTRELGVMRAIGAEPGVITGIIAGEGLIVAALSWIFAVAVSVPLSLLVGAIVGRLSFRTPLPLAVSPAAMVLWFVAVLTIAGLACAWPAYRASRLTVREALAYE